MPDDPDTDPAVADTQSSEPGSGSPAVATTSKAKRAVHSGDVLGRYELGDEVGEGGMATVYRARDRELRRDVAIKVLFPHLARRDEIVRRFHREARAAAGLDHPNILRIYDVGGADDEPPYIVMELIRGRSLLGEIEQRGAVLTEIVACLGALLADALTAAHAAGIIHRDIKPANVLIASGGRVLLADFGVARLETEEASLVTRTGALLGTPAYMSPEQATGDTATSRSDLYSLGATLYQLATGALPYGGTAAKVLSQIATGSLVAPVRRRPAVGAELSRVIERLMASEQSARPAKAGDVAKELRAIATAGGFGDPTDELAAYFVDPDAFLRERTPTVVAATVTAAAAAIDAGKLPRAVALADRAAALAPEDPAVVALVERVTEGGRSTQRRKVLAIAAGAVLVAAAGTAGVVKLRGGSQAAGDAAQLAVLPARDSAPPRDVEAPDAPSVDAAPVSVDASVVVSRDAGMGHRDARTVAADASAVATAPVDAGEIAIATVAVDAGAVVATGFVRATSDAWCDLSIDKRPQGRLAAKDYEVAVGHHTVACGQNGHAGWAREVDVVAGQTARVEGRLFDMIDVTFAIDASIDGAPQPRGTVLKLKPGHHQLQVGDTSTYSDIRFACTVRSSPNLDCYR